MRRLALHQSSICHLLSLWCRAFRGKLLRQEAIAREARLDQSVARLEATDEQIQDSSRMGLLRGVEQDSYFPITLSEPTGTSMSPISEDMAEASSSRDASEE